MYRWRPCCHESSSLFRGDRRQTFITSSPVARAAPRSTASVYLVSLTRRNHALLSSKVNESVPRQPACQLRNGHRAALVNVNKHREVDGRVEHPRSLSVKVDKYVPHTQHVNLGRVWHRGPCIYRQRWPASGSGWCRAWGRESTRKSRRTPARSRASETFRQSWP